MKWFVEQFKILITVVVILWILLIFYGCNTSSNVTATEKNNDVSLIKFVKEEQKWQGTEVVGRDIGLGQKLVNGIRQGVDLVGSLATEAAEEE